MAGVDDNVVLTGDWGAPSPSPRTIFSRMLGEYNDAKSISDPPRSAITEELLLGAQDPIATGKPSIEDTVQYGHSNVQFSNPSSLSEQKSSSRGGLVERMASRAGYNAPRLNTQSIRSADVSLKSDILSPYLAIPPDLSPTSLLDSPVFLSNSLAQPSPTTGKFPFISNGNIRGIELSSDAREKSKGSGFDDIYTSSLALKPPTDVGSTFYHGAAQKINSSTQPQEFLPGIEVPFQSENSFHSQSINVVKVQAENKISPTLQADFVEAPSHKENGTNLVSSDQRAFDSVSGSTKHYTPLEEQADEEGDLRGSADSLTAGVGGTPSEDGYNWRKYGQKQVKGSEYPRSYYKCTYPSCNVKKQVERSHEGLITEIIYKGAHNHPKPPPNRRSAIGSLNPLTGMQVDNPEHIELPSGGDGDLGWASAQKGNITRAADWKHDSLEVTSSASVGPEHCNQSPNMQTQSGGTHFESGDAVDASSTFSNEEDEDDQATHGSVSLGYDGEGDESESKRRKLESYATELSGATRAIREPRVVVQTTSEVDILDDGYRWRKYGQKVVKGNPNPRSYYKCTNAGCTVRKHVGSYYKCTSAGCTVRKHVERASHDLKSVITTYEGKHNHDVPAARTSSHVNAAASMVPGQAPTAIQSHVHKPEPSQVHNIMGRLERHALGSLNLPGRQQLGPSLGHGFSFGVNQPGMANLAMAGLGPTQGKLPVIPVHPFFSQQRPPNDMGFMFPKGEPNVEPNPEGGLNMTVYQGMMNRMPLGP